MKNIERIRELEGQIEALTIALPEEEAAHLFYMGLANGASHKGAREMFIKLADQERRHKDDLENLIKELKEQLEKLKRGEEDDGLWEIT